MPMMVGQNDEEIVPMHNKAPIDFSKVNDSNAGQDQIGGEVEAEKFSGPDQSRIDIMSQYFNSKLINIS